MRDFLSIYREAAPVVDAGGGSATIVLPPEGAAAAPAAGAAPTYDQLHDQAIAATEAWQADPKPELKQKAIDAVAAAKAFKQPAAPQFTIPDAYKDKPYLKGVDSPEKLFKMLEGAQELIGKKAPVKPADGAPQADFDAYYEALGRPKTAAEYVFEPVADVKYDDKLMEGVKELFFKNGVSSAQAKEVQKGFDSLILQIAKEKGIELQKQNVDFDKLGTESFGADRDKVLATSKALFEKHSSPNMKSHVAALSNESLVVLADVLNNINKVYIKQDGPPGGGPSNTGLTPAERSAKGRELMSLPAFSDPWHKDHLSIKQQVAELYKP